MWDWAGTGPSPWKGQSRGLRAAELWGELGFAPSLPAICSPWTCMEQPFPAGTRGFALLPHLRLCHRVSPVSQNCCVSPQSCPQLNPALSQPGRGGPAPGSEPRAQQGWARAVWMCQENSADVSPPFPLSPWLWLPGLRGAGDHCHQSEGHRSSGEPS